MVVVQKPHEPAAFAKELLKGAEVALVQGTKSQGSKPRTRMYQVELLRPAVIKPLPTQPKGQPEQITQ